MRIGTIVSLLLCVGITGISFAESTVDLDAPGAIEALARDHPAHYRKVMEELAKPQTYFILPVPVARLSRRAHRPVGAGRRWCDCRKPRGGRRRRLGGLGPRGHGERHRLTERRRRAAKQVARSSVPTNTTERRRRAAKQAARSSVPTSTD